MRHGVSLGLACGTFLSALITVAGATAHQRSQVMRREDGASSGSGGANAGASAEAPPQFPEHRLDVAENAQGGHATPVMLDSLADIILTGEPPAGGPRQEEESSHGALMDVEVDPELEDADADDEEDRILCGPHCPLFVRPGEAGPSL
eukprot:TRINITY_DN74280_c0_g1_i1.p1 TRINITY_DN74280_c0_g1~~TRINITY_DN74280_c0_g1_i1.p1  ORF type:complete len:148 (-),score=34.76 TRINITY_DN74280_c0_g1_i1:47-490(-)